MAVELESVAFALVLFYVLDLVVDNDWTFQHTVHHQLVRLLQFIGFVVETQLQSLSHLLLQRNLVFLRVVVVQFLLLDDFVEIRVKHVCVILDIPPVFQIGELVGTRLRD